MGGLSGMTGMGALTGMSGMGDQRQQGGNPKQYHQVVGDIVLVLRWLLLH